MADCPRIDSIADAVLRVVDKEGNVVVPNWTTEVGKYKEVTVVFAIGKEYTLTEISEEQYIVMLPSCSYESAGKVVHCIRTNFNREMGSKKIGLKAEMREVSIDYDLPLEGEGGAS